MQHITDFNPWLPDTQQVTPATVKSISRANFAT